MKYPSSRIRKNLDFERRATHAQRCALVVPQPAARTRNQLRQLNGKPKVVSSRLACSFAFNRVAVVGALLTAATLATPALAADNLQAKINQLLISGTQKSYESQGGHDFKLKTVVIEKAGNLGDYYVDGRITHDLHLRDDDIFHYCAKMNARGDLLEYRTSVNRGGFTRTIVSGTKSIQDIYSVEKAGAPLNLGDLATRKAMIMAGDQLGKLIDGDWLPAANEAATAIVIATASKLRSQPSALTILEPGEKLDLRRMNRCPRRKDKSLH